MSGRRRMIAETSKANPILMGVLGWWDASDRNTMFNAASGGTPSADGSKVLRLEDKSGHGKHLTQGNSDFSPAVIPNFRNGLSALGFLPGQTMSLSDIISAHTDYTMFMVLKINSTGDFGSMCFQNGTTENGFGLWVYPTDKTKLSVLHGGIAWLPDGFWFPSTELIMFHPNEFGSIVMNRNTLTVETEGSGGVTPATTFCQMNSANDMQVMELMIFPPGITSQVRSMIEESLMNKWAISRPTRDNFALNDGQLVGRIPDNKNIGQAWTLSYGSLEMGNVFADQAYIDTNTTLNIFTIEGGGSDGFLNANAVFGDYGDTVYLVFRFVDSSNYWTFGIRDGYWEISRVIGGTSELMAEDIWGGAGAGNSNRLMIRMLGSNLDFYINSAIIYNRVDTTHQTATRHGMAGVHNASNGSVQFEDFTFSPA